MRKDNDLRTIRFGTDGWRAKHGTEINFDTVGAVASAFARYCHRHHRNPSCVVGYDGRSDSEEFAQLFASILLSRGIDTILSDTVTPTPCVSFYTQKHGLSAGVMITASHNPPAYNGIKFKGPYGGPFMNDMTQEVEELLGEKYAPGKPAQRKNILDDYFDHIIQLVDIKAIRETGLKPLVDSMGGAGQYLLEKFLKEQGIPCTTIFGEARPDFYGRSAEPMEKNLFPAAKFLKQNPGYCCGFATDGDADRLGVILEDGEWLSAQEAILLLADHMISERKEPGALVRSASVTDKTRRLSSDSHPLKEVQVGFKYICEEMLKTHVAFGAEESGGFGYGMHIPERDGILSALLFLEMLARSGHTKLSGLVHKERQRFGRIHYARIDHIHDHPQRNRILPRLNDKELDKFGKFDILDRVSYKSAAGKINGLKYRLSGNCRWVLLRASETEPLMRIYAEGQSENEVDELLRSGIAHIGVT